MGIQKHFINFHNSIKLSNTDDAYSQARKKDDSIVEEIKTAFKEAGYPVINVFIQGSFSTDTAIVSLDKDFDIDRAIVIDAGNAPDNPVEPKKVVLDVLDKRGFKNAKIKKPCVTADYASENLHIDLPIYKLKDNNYELAIGKKNSDEANREWSVSDPKGLRDWIKNNSSYGASASSKQQQYNRIVRYLKRWRDEQFSEDVSRKVYSIGLTVMAKQCFNSFIDDDGQPDDLQAMKNTVSNILNYGYLSYQSSDQYKVSVSLPVSPYRDIFDGSSLDTGTQLRYKLTVMQSKLNDAISENDEIKQCKILNKLFGSDFIIPDDSNNSASKVKSVDKAVFPSAGAVGTSHGA